jgi:transcriptional regulator with PAS, ATPase and Fis domain
LTIHIVNRKGDRIPVSISTAILRDDIGKIIGGVESFRDLSETSSVFSERVIQHCFKGIISKDREMHHLFQMLELVSNDDTTILLEGESGTGKELFARAIHSLSHRRNGPMITLNCGALPDTLLESELFGYKAGAFTDAKKDKLGRLALAQSGSLFLDEIGDISPFLQVKFLRVLQDKVYEPLGSTKSQRADVRIIASTNKNLEELVQRGLFREDLYYRINIVKLTLPPLRKRKEDVPLLVEHFINKFNNLRGKEIRGISPDAMKILMSCDFPGNIRELENVIEYATLICRNDLVGTEHLPENIHRKPIAARREDSEESIARECSLEDLERDFIYRVLRKNRWSRKLTAAQMGIHPTTLWRRIKRLNLQLQEANDQ